MSKYYIEDLPEVVATLVSEIKELQTIVKGLKIEYSKATSNDSHRFCLKDLQGYLPDHPAAPTVYGWVRNGLIPHYKVGKKLFFKKSEIDQWLDSGRQKTEAELESEAVSYINDRRVRR